MAAVTLVEVARHAGVSLATASRVLNGSARVPTAGIALRVKASARELGYVPNAQAQALARSATGLVGLVVHDIGDPYFSTITRAAQRSAGVRRSQLLLAGAERDEQAELRAVSTFISYRTDAIILAGSRRTGHDDELASELGRYTRNGGRVVTFGRSTVPGARFLQIGHRAGAGQLVTALLARGVTDFAILAGPPELSTARERVIGYQEALAAAGRAPLLVLHSDFDREGGLVSAQRCWDRLTPEQRGRRVCLLAVNDLMALGAIAGLRDRGVAVPEDVQVAGFDDIPTLQDFTPPLTTVHLPLELIGERAVELALTSSSGPAPVIPGEPVLRTSAG